MISIDQLCYQSKLRYINAGEKFAFAVLTLLLCVMSRSTLIAIITLLVTGILSIYMGGIPFFRYLRYLLVPLTFLFLSTLAILFHLSQVPQELFAIPLPGGWYLTSNLSSLQYCMQLILAALASVSCLYFLSFHTPMPDILHVLSCLHCPKIFIELTMLIYRFIFIMLHVSSAISTSQNSRLGNKDYRTSLKCFSALASTLLIRSFKRANALYNAMESRCYNGDLRVLNESYPPKKSHIIAIVIFDSLLLLIMLYSKGIH